MGLDPTRDEGQLGIVLADVGGPMEVSVLRSLADHRGVCMGITVDISRFEATALEV